jgi:hypothetical protein
MEDTNPISVLNTVFGMIGSFLAVHDAQKEKLFEKHVEPLHQRMLAIHQDYVTGFSEVKRHLEDKTQPGADLILFLEQRRRDYSAERDLAIQLAEKLADAERRAVRPDAWGALKAYCEAVSDYFFAPSQFAHKTWYTRYLEKVKANIHFATPNVWFDGSIYGDPKGEHARTQLIYMATSVLDRELPAALKDVNATYARLRALLL